MGSGHRVSRIVAFFRSRYPAGAPSVGYAPLLSLLPRRVSDDEMTVLTSTLLASKRRWLDRADLGVEITRLTHEMPLLNDIARIQRRLSEVGRPGGRHDTPPV